MPVYNAEKFLRESIDSILRQTFLDFEFIIINDGSRDESQKIIDEYAKRDKRIIALRQNNHGVVYTANKAIQTARGKYIARMDADDISIPERLEEQYNILEKNPKIILACSSFEVFSDDGEFQYKDTVPPDNIAIKQSLYVRNPIANGSTLIRKSALEDIGLFDDVFAEDLHMWIKLFDRGEFQSTGTVLYRWRMNPNGLTLTNNSLTHHKSLNYISELWQKYPPTISSRRDLRRHSQKYIEEYGKRGRNYREIYLVDASRLASRFINHNNFMHGLRQLLNVALSSKAGFRIALQRIYFVIRGKISYPKKNLNNREEF